MLATIQLLLGAVAVLFGATAVDNMKSVLQLAAIVAIVCLGGFAIVLGRRYLQIRSVRISRRAMIVSEIGLAALLAPMSTAACVFALASAIACSLATERSQLCTRRRRALAAAPLPMQVPLAAPKYPPLFGT